MEKPRCRVYYEAKNLALNNGRNYHLAAILRRNKSVIRVGENTNKTHPKYKRAYGDGGIASCMHAEMNVLRFAKPGDTIEVMRFSKDGSSLTMAKPCPLCMAHMRSAGIKKVRYTDWTGKWIEKRL